jgi:integrase
VPVPPDLVRILDRHIEQFPAGHDGRLFITRRGPYNAWKPNLGKPLNSNAYTTAWKRAREQALTPAQVRSPLAKRPYDRRHAAVSLWPNAGVPAIQVAEWAGHSVQVLMRVYAKCIEGQQEENTSRIPCALGGAAVDRNQPNQSQDHR